MAQVLLSQSAQDARVQAWRDSIVDLLRQQSPRPVSEVLQLAAKKSHVIPGDVRLALNEAELDADVVIDYHEGTVQLTR